MRLELLHLNRCPSLEANRQPSKRRKRKGSAANSEAGAGRATKRKQSPVPVPPQGLAQPGVGYQIILWCLQFFGLLLTAF